ncbi:Alpha/Beta hydrolase protein [Xylaria bambusicola]|uniref:Alpha/Beta hydrolase protein n=1 Tax=Xylaria bambusicola TaxID=326684 RepID=UPI0020078896|nr:Alpha/Beta hydrolase protein [Xylaria bambusicola]KAI0523746.1 Alpha/Beta hydrolase protein [Xylaria bambusicola]
MDAVTKCFSSPNESTTTAVVVTTVVTTLAIASLTRFALWPRKPEIIKGALTTSVPRLSKDELAKAAYRIDHFPGARDVATPYGNIRVYEFGPEQGRKVLFIHGISTSCMTLSDIANSLVEKGCRVMMFDLFGRGYSDAPGDLPYDTRLFVSQILLVLASSPLSWTGNNAFSLIGYSLGGGIAVNFAATFPDMVESLILLAPAGMIRPENIGRLSRLIFTSGLVPERLLAWMTKSRLRSPIDNAVSKKRSTATKALSPAEDKEDFVDVAVQEAVDPPTQQNPTPFELEVVSFVHWSLDYNEGFVPAMMSTIRYAPLMEQQEYWRLLAKRKPGTTAVLIGHDDNLIQREDYEEDALPLIGGKDNVFWRIVPGAHNFPFTHPSSALKAIYEFWGMS